RVRRRARTPRETQCGHRAKIPRAHAPGLASRPYEERLRTAPNGLAPDADPETSPLLARRPVSRVGVVLVTTDRGLVGPMNVNLIRATLRFAQQQSAASYVAVGRKCINGLG